MEYFFKQFFPDCLGDAVDIARKEVPNLANEMVVEHYPSRPFYPSDLTSTSRIFCYQFFNTEGKNCATYIPDMNTISVYTPRVWGLSKNNVQSLERFLTPR